MSAQTSLRRAPRVAPAFHLRSAVVLSVLPLAVLFIAACGDYTATTRKARDEFYAGKYTEAAKALEKGAHEDGVNQVLFLFDRATALHQGGDYEESIKDFQLADKLTEIKDYTSLSTEAATLITNDKIVPYRGEDFEKVLISQYLALDYLMLGKYEDALVECRRVNHKLHLMISEGKRKYKLNPFASYVSAMLYENAGEWNDAYVDYQAVHQLVPGFNYLGEDLYRLAWRNGIREDVEKWAQEYRLSEEDKKRIRETASKPEIVVIVENGHSPEKRPNPAWAALPKYYPRSNPIAYADISVNKQPRDRSYVLFDVERTAIENLDEKFAGLIAKRIAGVVTKEVVAHQVEKRTDPLVGALLRIGMYVADQADLRSWLTLPKDFQIVRLRVSPGDSYAVQVQPKAVDGTMAGRAPIEKVIHFPAYQRKPQRVFIPVRIL